MLVAENPVIAAESHHYYAGDGPPVETVPLGKPKREGPCPVCRTPLKTTAKNSAKCKECGTTADVKVLDLIVEKDVTFKDAVKFNLSPSVSAMKSWSPTPQGLKTYNQIQSYDAMIETFKHGASDWTWKKAAVERQKFLKDLTMDRGTQMHGYIQKALDGVEYKCDSIAQTACDAVCAWIDEQGVDQHHTERYFCNREYGCGGTIDYDGILTDGTRLILDYKTKQSHDSYEKLATSQKPFDEYIVQLAGYWWLTGGGAALIYCVPISQVTGESTFIHIPQDRVMWGKECFLANLRAWKQHKEYWPEDKYHSGEWTSSTRIKELILEASA